MRDEAMYPSHSFRGDQHRASLVSSVSSSLLSPPPTGFSLKQILAVIVSVNALVSLRDKDSLLVVWVIPLS